MANGLSNGNHQPHDRRAVRVVSVSSGKGGVGKTTVAINLALGLARRNRSVLLFDADVGLANVDVLLGLNPERNLSHVVAGECELEEILVPGPNDIQVVPGASGLRDMANLDGNEIAGLIYAFSSLSHQTDWLVVDAPAGIDDAAVRFCGAAHENIIVVCNDPASITDAYATIKQLHQSSRQRRFRVVVNMVGSEHEGRQVFQRLVDVTDRFLDVTLDLVGTVPLDTRIRDASRKRRALLDLFPSSPASLQLQKLAERTDNWPMPAAASGSLEYFVEQLLQGDPVHRQEQVTV